MITLVGMGPGHIDYVIPEAIKAIKRADRNIAFGRIGDTAKQITTKVVCVNALNEVIKNLVFNGEIALLASGDACFFGILDYLKKEEVVIDSVIPGITSFQYLLNRLQLSWHNANLLSLHGRESDLLSVINHPLSIILTDKNNPPGDISKKISKLGVKGTIHAGFDLSYPTESIVTTTIGNHIKSPSPLCTLAIMQE